MARCDRSDIGPPTVIGQRFDREATVRTALIFVALLAVGRVAAGQNADDYRGGWRTDGGEAHTYQFSIRGSTVRGVYCTYCADATTLAFVDGTVGPDGIGFEVTHVNADGSTRYRDSATAVFGAGTRQPLHDGRARRLPDRGGHADVQRPPRGLGRRSDPDLRQARGGARRVERDAVHDVGRSHAGAATAALVWRAGLLTRGPDSHRSHRRKRLARLAAADHVVAALTTLS